jgi:hypothetical protein
MLHRNCSVKLIGSVYIPQGKRKATPVFEHHVLTKFGGVEVKLCKFLNSTLDGLINLFPALYLRSEGQHLSAGREAL